ncbi:MAG: DUF6088 family protein [Chitinophagaceae bacterium]
MKYIDTIEGKLASRITKKNVSVFLREDFTDLAGYDQVGRALQNLTQKGKLIRIGYGLYAKAKTSRITGKQVPVKPLPTLAKDALKRLGVKIQMTKAELEYGGRNSTQIPTGRLIGVNKRVNRKIGYKGALINYEVAAR